MKEEHPNEESNFHSAWRLQLAQQIATAYRACPDVVTVFVHGSVARSRADKFSDVEMAIFWAVSPSDIQRQDAVTRAGGTGAKLSPYEPAYQAWTEEYLVSGVKIDVGHWTMSSIETMIHDVILRYDTTFSKQTTLSIIQHAAVLYGEDQLQSYQAQIAHYPEELARAMVLKHLSFSEFGSRKMLAIRNEVPLLYANHCRSIQQLMGVLLGLNRIYYPGFKWTREVIKEMGLTPVNTFPRFERIFHAGALEGTCELETLIEEVFDLVEANFSGIDVGACRERFRQPYPSWDKMPLFS